MKKTYPKMKLRDILALCNSSLPDGRLMGFENILPEGDENVRLCFMSEKETHIETYSSHPVLIPWYDCEVDSIGVDDDTLEIWLDYVPYWQKMIGFKEKNDEQVDSQ